MNIHELPDCLLVWLNPNIKFSDSLAHGDEICDQGWADAKWGGFNEILVKRIRKRRRNSCSRD